MKRISKPKKMINHDILHSDSNCGVIRPANSIEEDKIYEVMNGGNPELAVGAEFTLVENSVKSKDIGDTVFFAGLNIFKSSFIDKYFDRLDRYGAIIPIKIVGITEQFYWYIVTNLIDCLDMDRSEYSYFLSKPEEIRSISLVRFKNDESPDDLIFGLSQGPFGLTFIRSELSQEIIDEGFVGFGFGNLDSMRL